MRLILASASPRRKELMKEISSDFLVVPSNIDEDAIKANSIREKVALIAHNKGISIKKDYPEDVVISADTIVVLDNEVIGKPKDEEDAIRILKKLSGSTHEVLTAYSIFYKDEEIQNIVSSFVTFNVIDDEIINEYVASKSPLDKAGAYGVQDNDKYHFIKETKGSMDNIIGFPVKEIKESLKKIGL